MLTATDVAHLLHIHINTVRRWSNKGLLKAYRVGPRGDRRFLQQDIATFLVEQSEKTGNGHSGTTGDEGVSPRLVAERR